MRYDKTHMPLDIKFRTWAHLGYLIRYVILYLYLVKIFKLYSGFWYMGTGR